mgnify:CR=1 FL=1
MKITAEILTAIQKTALELGSQNKLAELAKIPQTNISKYLSGTITNIRESTWFQLYPIIKNNLPHCYSGGKAVSDIISMKEKETWHIRKTEEIITEVSDSINDIYSVTIKTISGREHEIRMDREEFLLWRKMPEVLRSDILLRWVKKLDESFITDLIINGICTREELREQIAARLQKFPDAEAREEVSARLQELINKAPAPKQKDNLSRR